jgi:DNA-binding CsgD family transcriptional regulator
LSALNPTAAKELRDAITRAAASGSSSIGSFGIAVPIAAVHGEDVTAWVLPLDSGLRRELAAPFAARIAVFIKELSDISPFPGELFVRRYKITPSECRFMMMLTQGMTLKEAAYAAGVAESTAKTHLHNLFTKTGTKRQADLVRLVAAATNPARAGAPKQGVE